MGTICIDHYESPFGALILGSFQENLVLCDWKYRTQRKRIDKRIKAFINAEYADQKSDITELAKTQLQEYFNRQRQHFDIPYLLCGSSFQNQVWNELALIPYGSTLTYNQLSIKLQNPQGIRAVAAANGANALSIIIPCHRVIGSRGEMTGYAGGVDVKKKLLNLESPVQQLELFRD